MPRFMLEGLRPRNMFCFGLIHLHELRNKHLYSHSQKREQNIQRRTLSSFITIPLY